jgi:hypothetical protein
MVAIWVKQIELVGVDADVGQGNLGETKQGHDDKQILEGGRQLGHG